MSLSDAVKKKIWVGFRKDVIWAIGGVGLASLSNAVFHFVVGRALGPSGYSLFGVYNALFVILQVIFSALRNTLARQYAVLPEEEKQELKIDTIPFSFLMALLGTILLFVLKKEILNLIKSEFGPEYSYFLLFSFFTIFLYTALAPIHGAQRIFLLNLFIALPYTLRAIFIVLSKLTTPHLTLAHALMISAVSFGIVSAVIPPYILGFTRLPKKSFLKSITNKHVMAALEHSLTAVPGTLAYTLIFMADIILARAKLDPEIAGIFSAVAFVGKMPVYIVEGVSLAALPKLAVRHREGKHKLFWFKNLLLIIGLLFLYTVAIALARNFILPLLFGKAYASGGKLLLHYTLSSFSFSMLCFVTLSSVSLKSRTFQSLLFLASIISTYLMYRFADSWSDLIYGFSGISIILFAIFAMMFLLPQREKKVENNET